MRLVEGDRVKISGYADELWIEDYGTVRVVSEATVAVTPSKYAKKVLINIDSIDGENNVCAAVRRSKIIKVDD